MHVKIPQTWLKPPGYFNVSLAFSFPSLPISQRGATQRERGFPQRGAVQRGVTGGLRGIQLRSALLLELSAALQQMQVQDDVHPGSQVTTPRTPD